MGIVNQDNITDVVIESLGKNGDITDRQREIMTSLEQTFNNSTAAPEKMAVLWVRFRRAT